MAQDVTLYNNFSKLSDEQLENVINGNKHTDEAKEIAKEILSKRKNGDSDSSTIHQDFVDLSLKNIAEDVRTIKSIMIIFAIITAVSALVTVIQLLVH